MKRLAILGSTGSIGVSTLDVVEAFPDAFEVVALAAGSNLDLLEEQIRRVRPETVSVRDAEAAAELRRRTEGRCRVLHGDDGPVAVSTHDGVDLVVRSGRWASCRRTKPWGSAGMSRWPTKKPSWWRVST